MYFIFTYSRFMIKYMCNYIWQVPLGSNAETIIFEFENGSSTTQNIWLRNVNGSKVKTSIVPFNDARIQWLEGIH